jgi:RimJ/RimL family protein N-acetyltransferase
LNSDRLQLREVSETDQAHLISLLSDPRQVRYIEFEATENSAQCLWQWCRKAAQEMPRTAYALAIYLAGTDTFVGVATLVIRAPDASAANIGIILHRHFQGKGFAKEAGRTLIAFAFETLKLPRVQSSCHPENWASVHALERAGFQRLPDTEPHEEKGQVHDRVLFALLREEWEDLLKRTK